MRTCNLGLQLLLHTIFQMATKLKYLNDLRVQKRTAYVEHFRRLYSQTLLYATQIVEDKIGQGREFVHAEISSSTYIWNTMYIK